MQFSERGWGLVKGVSVLSGWLAVVCLVIVLADVGFLMILFVEQANAWYFPYSLFILPVLLVSGVMYFLTRWALRRR